MKAALVSYEFGQYCIELANGLARECELLLVLNSKVADAHLSELDPAVRLHSFRAPRLRHAVRQVFTTWRLLRTVAFDPDVIHLQHGHLWFNLALPLLKRKPLVLTIHDVRHHPGDRESRKTPQAIKDFGVRRADELIVHGAQLKQMVIDELKVREERVHVIPHVAIGNPPAAPTAAVNGPPEVLFFGRIWDYKGLEYLIRAEPLITVRVPQAKIVIAGEGESFERYRQLMVHPDRFIVHNEWISDQRRAELFQRASVVALPYTEASQSGVIPVAYNFRKPVVATRVGSLPEVVDDGVTGYLVPPREEADLADAVVRILQDAGLRRQMGQAGKQKLERECSPRAVGAKTLDVYRAAISRVEPHRRKSEHPRPLQKES